MLPSTPLARYRAKEGSPALRLTCIRSKLASVAATRKNLPRPTVAVDVALLTWTPGDESLSVLQVRRDGERGWALPGTVLRDRERLHDAVQRCLRERVGVAGLLARQLRVLDDPDHENGWRLSVAHLAVAPADRLAGLSRDTRFAPVEAPGRLPHGQGAVVRLAVEELRRNYASTPDPDGLLPDTFTVLDLRRVHAAVAGQPLQKDTFRRVMEPQLAGTGETAAGVRGRPAELFRRA